MADPLVAVLHQGLTEDSPEARRRLLRHPIRGVHGTLCGDFRACGYLRSEPRGRRTPYLIRSPAEPKTAEAFDSLADLSGALGYERSLPPGAKHRRQGGEKEKDPHRLGGQPPALQTYDRPKPQPDPLKKCIRLQ